MPSRPAGRPRTKPPEERRGDLMKAAERLFLAKGVEETTIDEIAEGAAVSKGAFYLHFSSKAAVVEALRGRFAERVLARIVEALRRENNDDWRGKLAAWSRACAVSYLETARLHRLIFSSAPPPAREGLTRNILIDHLSALLADGAREGAWRIDDPHFTAIFLFNALHGVVNEGGAGESDADRRGLLNAVEEHFLRCVD